MIGVPAGVFWCLSRIESTAMALFKLLSDPTLSLNKGLANQETQSPKKQWLVLRE